MKKFYHFLACVMFAALGLNAAITPPDNLYLVGNFNEGARWNANDEYKFSKLAYGIFEIKNIGFSWENKNDPDKSNDNKFKILTTTSWEDNNNQLLSKEEKTLNLLDNSVVSFELATNSVDFIVEDGIYNIAVDFNNEKITIYPAELYIVGSLNDWGAPDADAVLNPVNGQPGVYVAYEVPSVIGYYNSFRLYSKLSWDAVCYGPDTNGIDTEVAVGFSLYKDAQSGFVATQGGKGKFQFYNAPSDRKMTVTVNLNNSNFKAVYDGDDVAYPESLYIRTDESPNANCAKLTAVAGEKGCYYGSFTPNPATDYKFRVSDHNGSIVTGTEEVDGQTVDKHLLIPDNYGSYGAESDNFNIENLKDNIQKIVSGHRNYVLSINEPGEVFVEVNLVDGNIKFEKFEPNKREVRENLYLVGAFKGCGWNIDNAAQMNRISDNVFKIENVVIEKDNSGIQFIYGKSWNDDKLLPVEKNYLLPINESKDFVYYRNGIDDKGTFDDGNNFVLNTGVYNITVDYSNHTVKAEPVERYVDMDIDMEMRFWEGPLHETALKKVDNDKFHLNTENNNVTAKFQPYDVVDGRFIYKIDLSENEKEIEYVSQMFFGGYAVYHIYTYADGKFTKEDITPNDYIDAKNEYWKAWRTFYFDAHSVNTLVPVERDFWCDNSRMEVGLKVKAVYLRVDTNEPFNKDANQTPFTVLLSTDGNIDLNAPEQQPLNSDEYAITLTSGEIYDALKGTRTGAITVPFSRHAAAEEGYVINLGKSITTKEIEKFEFLVNGIPVNKTFTVDGVNKLIPDPMTRSISTVEANLTFNQIILMVEGQNYSDYRLWFRNGTTVETAPKNYYAHARNPMLKVWIDNDASWDDMYNSSLTADHQEGTVKYYEFEPVNKTDNSAHVKTNLYYLDLPGGVTIRKAGYDKEGSDKKHYDQFNILDQDGYDVSNPYQGSQFIYPGTWWCANPNLLDENGTRSFQGHSFKDVPEFPSRVDLAFNLADNEGDEMKIYGITLFKIVGRVYDIYAQNERETNVYYIYAHTEPRSGATVREKCEQTAPIMLRVNSGAEIKATGDNTLVSYQPKYAEQYKSFNDPAFSSDNGNYMLKLAEKELPYNADLNYMLENIELKPNVKEAIEFIDVSGSQRWAATGTDDELRPNKWSNYYTGDFHTENPLNVNRPNSSYYKVVLATNPDQVRYQIMSMDISISAEPDFIYQSTNDSNYDPQNELIYPVTDVSTILIWRDGYTIDVELIFTDGDNNTYTKTVTFNEKPEGSSIPDSEGFYKDGESPFEASLGTYFTRPGVKISATATYKKGDETETLKSNEETTQDLPCPVLENLSAEAHGDTDTSVDNGVYVSSLSWNTDDADYPRHYEFYQYDVTNVSDKENHTPDSPEAINKGCHFNGTTDIDRTEINGTLLKDGEIDGYISTVTIGYRGRALYHFAVPTTNGPAMIMEAEPDFTTLKDGFSQVNTTSHDDGINNYAYAQQPFAFDLSTGVEEIEIDSNAPVEFYNLQGVRVENPAGGIFIRRQGNTATKVMIP